MHAALQRGQRHVHARTIAAFQGALRKCARDISRHRRSMRERYGDVVRWEGDWTHCSFPSPRTVFCSRDLAEAAPRSAQQPITIDSQVVHGNTV